jgi:hypothetical protein
VFFRHRINLEGFFLYSKDRPCTDSSNCGDREASPHPTIATIITT